MAAPDWSTVPTPEDDGACKHLSGAAFASVRLPTTAGDGETIDPSSLPGLTVLFFYPRTAAPGETVPDHWNSIPGARGCTPQACSFRDASDELAKHGVAQILGVSTQSSTYQRELKERTHLPYEILSDEKLELATAMKLPTFDWEGKKLVKRLTLAVEDGKVIKVFYPVFPPDKSADEVLKWLRARKV